MPLDTTFYLIINNLIYVNFTLGIVVYVTHNTTIQLFLIKPRYFPRIVKQTKNIYQDVEAVAI